MKMDGFLYGKMKRYRRKFLVINLVCTVLYIAFVVARFPYIATGFSGQTPLDVDRFVSETDTIAVREPVTLGRKDTTSPESANFRPTTYWQDGKYLFEFELESVKDLDKVFTQTISTGVGPDQVMDVYGVYSAKLGGRDVIVLASSNYDLTKKVTGHLADIPKSVMAKYTEELAEGESLEVSQYMVDIRGVEMETETTDYAMFWIFMVLLIVLYAKLIIQYVNPRRTPTYRQLIKYGDVQTVEEDVNRQVLAAGGKAKGKLILEDYILYKGTFRYVVEKNHMSKH